MSEHVKNGQAAGDSAHDSGPGEVILLGGGPGPADLMTLRAHRALAEADVVYYDRLAPSDGLRDWAPQAELYDVGKRPGHHRIPQEKIQAMMIASAAAGKTVVRLKGGDPYVFGRGSEESQACREAGIPVRVIPGISSALAVPAVAGIPVTARGVARSVTVISAHDPLSEEEFSGLSALGGTIVVLMGVSTMGHTLMGLQRHGMRGTPAAVIENGYSDRQRVFIDTVDSLLSTTAAAAVRSPAVLVIGEVVRLAADHDEAADQRIRDLAGALL
ncbi:uroporphyrinogen-III C-methyltransferase [Citricoccus sp. NR2]|uniref:uroporphyrinogen-III C-methyltransferase n=1 Tax=Citricoccus sp. NR2 TaxID=3004095 RepID=UPI0022DDAA0A|nr:uroporphyrinogen-III C-methyltransferase [Citricoccus sp. NR2]WBL19367.1 uroporphyrinogen-III C-methyltransferase [Citricoccus sp. NR2]